MEIRSNDILPPGIFAWFGIACPFADRMKMIRDVGFTTTALWWEEDNEEGRFFRHFTPDLARNAGLYVENIHVPFRRSAHLWSPRKEFREHAVNEHLSWLKDCHTHQIPAMVCHVTTGRESETSWKHGYESIRQIIEQAEDFGILLVLENTRTLAPLNWLFQKIQSSCLRYCYDSGHAALFSDSPETLLLKWGDLLAGVHFSDNDLRLDRHWLPGKGKIDFSLLSSAVKWHQYMGSLLLEVIASREEKNIQRFLQDAYYSCRWLRSVLLDANHQSATEPSACQIRGVSQSSQSIARIRSSSNSMPNPGP